MPGEKGELQTPAGDMETYGAVAVWDLGLGFKPTTQARLFRAHDTVGRVFPWQRTPILAVTFCCSWERLEEVTPNLMG